MEADLPDSQPAQALSGGMEPPGSLKYAPQEQTETQSAELEGAQPPETDFSSVNASLTHKQGIRASLFPTGSSGVPVRYFHTHYLARHAAWLPWRLDVG